MDGMDLRVHIGATTTRDADRSYEAQAAAYLDFHPATVVKLRDDCAGLSRTATSEQVLGSTNEAEHPSSTSEHEVETTLEVSTYISDTQLAIAALDSQLFTLPEPLSRSTPKKRAYRDVQIAPVQATKVPSVAESISDATHGTNSSLLRTPVFHRPEKRQRHVSESALELPALQSTPPPLWRDLGAGGPEAQSSRVGAVPQQPVEESSSSQLPTLYSLSDITPDKSDRNLQHSASDPGPTAAESVDASTVSEAFSPLQRIPREADLSSPRMASTRQNTGDAIQTQAQDCQLRKQHEVEVIHAPRPKVSMDAFQSHVTPRLQILIDAPQTIELYRPRHNTRELQPLERGHWRFSISSWPVALRESFWSFMKEFVTGGGAGWGVWCVWTLDTAEGSEDSHVIVTHCWGEIVKHIYLLLYVASQSKVRKLGLQWVDAEDQVVVQMRSA